MSPEERDLIGGLFERMRSYGAPEKDHEADAFIQQQMRRNPDASYMLVQSVLMQEQALQEADTRAQELEAYLQELEDHVKHLEQQLEARQAPPARSGGGFLGGGFARGGTQPASFGRGAPEPAPEPPARGGFSTVPPVGRGQPAAQQPLPGPGGSPWSARGAAPAGQQPPPQQAAAGGGGFLKSAMATAAGVAGGMMLANSLGSLFGGSSAAQAATPGSSSTGETGGADYGPSASEASYGIDDNDPGGSYDSASDSGSVWGSDDIEI
jgi:hypothetical protein